MPRYCSATRTKTHRASATTTVSYLLIGHDGALWAGTGDGLSKFDPVTETLYYRLPQRELSKFGRPDVVDGGRLRR